MKIKKNQFIVKTISTIIILIASISIYTFIDLPGYKNQFLLPLTYLLFFEYFLFFYEVKYNRWEKKSILIHAIKIICYMKYVVCPLSYLYIINNGGWSGGSALGFGPEPSVHNLNMAILLQCLEIITLSIILMGYMKMNQGMKNNVKESFFNNKFIVILFLILSFPILFIGKSHDSGIIMVISKFFYILLLIFWIKLCFHFNFSRELRIVFSLIGLGIYIIFSAKTLSRWNIVFITVSFLITLYRMYENIPKKIIICSLILLCVAFIEISFLKFSWLFEESGNSIFALFGYYISQIPDYFSWIRPLAQSINLKDIYPITHTTFLNDILGNIPGFGDLVNNMDRMNIYFNLYNWGYYREVLIIPLLGEGFTFIGYLAPLYSAICLLVVLLLDTLINKTKNIEILFILTYSGLYGCMFPGFSLQIIMVHLFTITIPALLLFYINSKLPIKFTLKKS